MASFAPTREFVTALWVANENSIPERGIGTCGSRSLDHMIVLGERHLLRVLREYVEQHNAMRPHRSLALDSPPAECPSQRQVLPPNF